jgi:hypothetical protein
MKLSILLCFLIFLVPAFALDHTHTIVANPKPSKKDIAVAMRLKIPFYTISDKGIWVVDQIGNVRKIVGWEWDKNIHKKQAEFESRSPYFFYSIHTLPNTPRSA